MSLGVVGASPLAYGRSAERSADATVVSVHAGSSGVVKVESMVVAVPVVGDVDSVCFAAAAFGIAAAVGHADLLSVESVAAVFADCAAKFEAEVAEDLARSSNEVLEGYDLFVQAEHNAFGGRKDRRIERAPSSFAGYERTTW